MKIAAFVDKAGNALPFYESGIVKLFAYEGCAWRLVKEFEFETNEKMGLSEIRSRVYTMAGLLDDCRVFVTKFIKGFPYALLDGMGFSVWKVSETPELYLDSIREEEEKNRADREKIINLSVAPLPIGDAHEGTYRIDLVKVQAHHDRLNSKQVLLPFLQLTSFQKLEVICRHVPKWFERELPGLNLQLQISASDDGLCHVILSPVKTCGGD
ncbi:Fe-only nitrogenase accessory protein AnfO [Chloroherpeton thalassium ATCC 35110]|uniref:Fe-only nitrogenase accessory protein AnfO n=1 Tax=Chloroherpeton thalassium (strain ATCC 35110 / GB-78) TaxID=517418 RepID=B3QTU4_CHLT3|nr:Fe-only nitrogenase accessory protein AnfO [Chloroherpeton thalassium]ACF14292.1 Fe-only nitrogenase accessory protein AnfO [Chloroherpeton thalassium ATCC 35110]